ncbi:hypothetical protein BFW87_27210 [Pseudomonas fluorescens]|uniref:Uncharacterized protein n=1 Tax=Pseudomonas fluorescens TaxID=294 RepID=A0A1T2Y0Y9_PSEFL|nr:hypothetical protein BFW87_27210 [Pseudomonas fluorescens]
MEGKLGKSRWASQGKTIRQLICELETFSDQDLLVEISTDSGDTRKPISLVKKSGGVCLLVNSECEEEGSEE